MSAPNTVTLRVNYQECTGCRSCTIACALTHEHALEFHHARIRVEKNLPGDKLPLFKPVFCRNCKNARCVQVCPTAALVQEPATGVVNLQAARCNGCEMCVQVCPFDAIWMDHRLGIALKCDLCDGDPACVKNCPPGALIFEGTHGATQRRG